MPGAGRRGERHRHGEARQPPRLRGRRLRGGGAVRRALQPGRRLRQRPRRRPAGGATPRRPGGGARRHGLQAEGPAGLRDGRPGVAVPGAHRRRRGTLAAARRPRRRLQLPRHAVELRAHGGRPEREDLVLRRGGRRRAVGDVRGPGSLLQPEQQRQPGRRHLGGVVARLLPAGPAAARRRAVGVRARQPRAVQPRRPRLVLLPRCELGAARGWRRPARLPVAGRRGTGAAPPHLRAAAGGGAGRSLAGGARLGQRLRRADQLHRPLRRAARRRRRPPRRPRRRRRLAGRPPSALGPRRRGRRTAVHVRRPARQRPVAGLRCDQPDPAVRPGGAGRGGPGAEAGPVAGRPHAPLRVARFRRRLRPPAAAHRRHRRRARGERSADRQLPSRRSTASTPAAGRSSSSLSSSSTAPHTAAGRGRSSPPCRPTGRRPCRPA